MSWTWIPVRTTGANAADPKINPFVMDHILEPIFPPWKSKSKKKRKWLGVDASTLKNPHFVMDLIHDSNPKEQMFVALDFDEWTSPFSHPIANAIDPKRPF